MERALGDCIPGRLLTFGYLWTLLTSGADVAEESSDIRETGGMTKLCVTEPDTNAHNLGLIEITDCVLAGILVHVQIHIICKYII